METKMSIVLSIICVLNPKDIIYIYIVYIKSLDTREKTPFELVRICPF